MSLLSEFAVAEPRPLPVLLLVDTSGSMRADGKIDAVNAGLREMIETLQHEDDGLGAIQISAITIGGEEAQELLPFQKVSEAHLEPFDAGGRTPLGHAFALATQLLEDHDRIPSRAYRPTVALISDGLPTDDWEKPLVEFLESPRASKAMRFALAIGGDCDPDMLRRFTGPDGLYRADQASHIRSFLNFVTMSVADRASSDNPEQGGTVPAPGDVPKWIDERY